MIAKRVYTPGQTSSIARLVRYVVNAQGGIEPRSWVRAADYILASTSGIHSKGEKVGGVRVTNCGTDDPADATMLVQATQAMNTRSAKDKTYHFVFSFPPGEEPPLEVLHAIEDDLVSSIEYIDHQRISAVHIDTDHLHVHVAINKVHPAGFQNIEPYNDKRRLMEACECLEVRYGLQRTSHGMDEEKSNERNKSNNRSRDGERVEPAPAKRPDLTDTRFREYLRKCPALEFGERPAAGTLNGLRNLSSCHIYAWAAISRSFSTTGKLCQIQEAFAFELICPPPQPHRRGWRATKSQVRADRAVTAR